MNSFSKQQANLEGSAALHSHLIVSELKCSSAKCDMDSLAADTTAIMLLSYIYSLSMNCYFDLILFFHILRYWQHLNHANFLHSFLLSSYTYLNTNLSLIS